ncbi:hypothetical protein [Hyalangium sp.]|uniref:hypothetical protein n=1 Tax=Hyalangium sp. TaxID=2028555 RepID=UPI002D5705A7|nr:hypothetical protein [Hyalangium sp.]HYH94444.1 hypothetical protein [Hyalangium sp.]
MKRITLSIACTLVLLTAPLAFAQSLHQQLNSGAKNPWATGVSPERQTAATDLFKQGNDYYERAFFLKASELYRKALDHWDHPAIHYNLALSLMDTGQKLELREHLEAALRYGAKPLDEKLFEHARKLKVFIEKQLIRVEISCDVAGASVSMDGRLLFTAPGRFEGWDLPGSHVLVTNQEGYPPNERIRTPREGEVISLHISRVYDDGELTRYRRHWATWKPWAMFGAGVALATGGGVLHQQARNDIREFDARATECELDGCPLTPELDGLRSRGARFQKMAIGTYAAGGALVFTGALLAFINRAEPYRLTPDEHEQGTQVVLQQVDGRHELWVTIRF